MGGSIGVRISQAAGSTIDSTAPNHRPLRERTKKLETALGANHCCNPQFRRESILRSAARVIALHPTNSSHDAVPTRDATNSPPVSMLGLGLVVHPQFFCPRYVALLALFGAAGQQDHERSRSLTEPARQSP